MSKFPTICDVPEAEHFRECLRTTANGMALLEARTANSLTSYMEGRNDAAHPENDATRLLEELLHLDVLGRVAGQCAPRKAWLAARYLVSA